MTAELDETFKFVAKEEAGISSEINLPWSTIMTKIFNVCSHFIFPTSN